MTPVRAHARETLKQLEPGMPLSEQDALDLLRVVDSAFGRFFAINDDLRRGDVEAARIISAKASGDMLAVVKMFNQKAEGEHSNG